MPAVQRVHKPTHLLPVPYISPLERWQSETSVFDAIEDVADLHTRAPVCGSPRPFLTLAGLAPQAPVVYTAAIARENGQYDLFAEKGAEGEFEGPTTRIFIDTELDPMCEWWLSVAGVRHCRSSTCQWANRSPMEC